MTFSKMRQRQRQDIRQLAGFAQFARRVTTAAS